MKQVWTFVIRGSNLIELSLPFNPVLSHTGDHMTVWKLVATEAVAHAARTIIESENLSVECYNDNSLLDEITLSD